MLRLIERIRAWKLAEESVDAVLIDDSTDFRQRDERMAKHLLDSVAASPDRSFMALTGNQATQGCGPLVLGERQADPAGQATLFPSPDSRGYDGTYSVGTVSASPPTKE